MHKILTNIHEYGINIAILKILAYVLNKIIIAFYSILFRIKLKYYKCTIGSKIKINGYVFTKFSHNSSLTISDNVTINSSFRSNLSGITNACIFHTIDNGFISIGKNSGLSSCVISSKKNIIIGENVKIGTNVRIFDHDWHSLSYLDRRDKKLDKLHNKAESIKIGDDVFIGTNSIILKGVNIGKRTIIGAGSVVSIKNIPPDSLVAGNPAKIIIRKG